MTDTESKNKMRESFTTFASNSTLHGLRYVVGKSSWCRRIVWIICVLLSSGFYLYLLEQSVATYMSLPINTHIVHEFPENGIPFPAVTICNLNSFVKSKIDIGYEHSLFKSLKLDLPACDVIRNVSGNLTCGQALLCVYHPFGPYVVYGCNETRKETIGQALNTTSRVFNPEEFLLRYGHDFNTMLIANYCMLSDHYECTNDFKAVVTPEGLCHTFSVMNNDNRPEPRVYYAGGAGGLNIMLNVQTSESTVGEWSIGFRVVVSEHGAGVNRQRGFNVHPGTHVVVAVSPKRFIRLKHPYKPNCSERVLPGYRVYTKDGCIDQCFNNATIKMCGCRLVGEPGFQEIPVCTLQDMECLYRAKEEVRKNRHCFCTVPCTERYFEPRVSYSKFPNLIGARLLSEKFKLSKSEQHISENLVFLQIGFAELAYQVDEQVPAYGASSLFGDVGGNMGLFLGCSLLTIVEFLDYCFLLVLARLQTKKTSPVQPLQNHQVTNENDKPAGRSEWPVPIE